MSLSVLFEKRKQLQNELELCDNDINTTLLNDSITELELSAGSTYNIDGKNVKINHFYVGGFPQRVRLYCTEHNTVIESVSHGRRILVQMYPNSKYKNISDKFDDMRQAIKSFDFKNLDDRYKLLAYVNIKEDSTLSRL